MSRKPFAELIPKVGKVSSTFLLPPKVIWCAPYDRGLRYHQPFRGPHRLTNDNFHRHIQYCITFYYYICHIDKYRNVEGSKFHNFGRFRISFFEYGGFCKTQPKSWESFLHISSPPEVIWCPPYDRGLRYHQPFRGPIRLTNYNFHADVHYGITIHYHMCSIEKYKNVGGPQCVSLWWAEISQSELTTSSSDLPTC